MLQLRQLDLHLAFARAGALREDVEYERRAVEDFAVEYLLQIAALCRGELVIEDDRIYIGPLAVLGKLLRLAFADICRGTRGN